MVYLERHVERKLREMAGFFRTVLVTGARQTGKSTLLSHVFPKHRAIVFDPVQDIYGARRDPDQFLASFPPPLILDEVQYVPELLPALKRHVDQHKTPGQYLLTGSQNLNVLKTVAESLAGRVGVLHLEGMTLSELCGEGGNVNLADLYLDHPDGLAAHVVGIARCAPSLDRALWRGGMPGLLDAPDHLASDYFRSYIATYIERDVRLLGEIRDMRAFDRLLGLSGALTAQEINGAKMAREVGVSLPTIQKWQQALFNTFQWLELPPYHGNASKRLTGRRKGYMRDTGVACHVQRLSGPEALAVSPLKGAMFETWVVNHWYRWTSALDAPAALWHWRTTGGAEVDLVLERDGRFFPIEIKCKTHVSGYDTRGIQMFRATYPHLAVQHGLVVYTGQTCYRINEYATAIPWNAICGRA